MVEITAEQQNKVKRFKRTEFSLRDLRENIKHIKIQIIGSQRRRKRKDMWNFLKRIWLKMSPSWKSQSHPRGAKRPIQGKPKEKHVKTQTNKFQTQRKNIERSKGKTTCNIQGKPHTSNTWSFSRNSAGQKRMAGYI